MQREEQKSHPRGLVKYCYACWVFTKSRSLSASVSLSFEMQFILGRDRRVLRQVIRFAVIPVKRSHLINDLKLIPECCSLFNFTAAPLSRYSQTAIWRRGSNRFPSLMRGFKTAMIMIGPQYLTSLLLKRNPPNIGWLLYQPKDNYHQRLAI